MATLAETLGAQSVNQPDISGNIQKGLQTGIQLATAAETVESKKLEVQQQKEQLANAQFTKVTNMLEKISQASPQARKRIATAYRGQLQQMNIPMSDATFEDLIQNEDMNRQIAELNRKGMLNQLGQNEQAREEVFAALVNEMGFADAVKQVYSMERDAAALRANEAAALRAERALDIQEKKANAGMGKENRKALNDMKIKFDSAIKDDLDAVSAAARAEALLNSGGTVSDEAAKKTVARMFDKGVLTEQDVAALSGGRGYYDQIIQFINKAEEGRLTDANRNELLRIVNTLRPVYEQKIRARAKRDAEAIQDIYGVDSNEAQQVLDVDSVLSGVGVKPKFDKNAFIAQYKKRNPKATDEEINAFLAQKGVK